MKTGVLIVLAIGMIGFGMVNMFRYVPISLSLVNRPFPFEHLYNVVPSEDTGISIQIGYLPINDAVNDPYWLFWSFVLYTGIVVTGFTIWRKRK
ncbi:MAG: hypothetical protein GKS07_10120 [Nitrosopumilus sp.]|nr:MAG: hypothetical protein GKS07_10120 [Nitrosopumilus sp.]